MTLKDLFPPAAAPQPGCRKEVSKDKSSLPKPMPTAIAAGITLLICF